MQLDGSASSVLSFLFYEMHIYKYIKNTRIYVYIDIYVCQHT